MIATTIDCPTVGDLRTHLDHPSPGVESHLDTCATCRDLMVTVAGDAGTVNRLLEGLNPPPETVPGPSSQLTPLQVHADGGTRRWTAVGRRAAGGAQRLTPGSRSRSRRAMATAVAAALAVTVVLTPGGRSAVAQFLDTFRGEQLQVVQLDPADLDREGEGLHDHDDLAALDDILADTTIDVPDPVQVAQAEQARAISGLQPVSAATVREGLNVPAVDATYMASPGGQVTLTLGATADNGVPQSLDGTVLRIAVPPTVATVLADRAAIEAAPGASGSERMMSMGDWGAVAGRSGTLEITSEGASLDKVRSFLLSRRELPAGLRQQLEGIEDWRNTLPIPLPADIAWEDVTVSGNAGLAFGDDSGLGAAVIWQRDGLVNGVVGSQARSDLMDLANQL